MSESSFVIASDSFDKLRTGSGSACLPAGRWQSQIPLYPPFSKGELMNSPLKQRGMMGNLEKLFPN